MSVIFSLNFIPFCYCTGQSVCEFRQETNTTTCAIVNATITLEYTYVDNEKENVRLSLFSQIDCLLQHVLPIIFCTLSLSHILRRIQVVLVLHVQVILKRVKTAAAQL